MSQHVVIVDDTAFNLRVLAEIVRKIDGVVVHTFESAAEALAWCDGHDVDCFVLDYHMPDIDGIEMTRRLRARAATTYVPIVMVTVRHERSLRYDALDAGVNDFVERPIDRREFQARVATFLSLQEVRQQLAMNVSELTESLVNEEQRSRDHAGRLQTLWQIATNPSLDRDDVFAAVLKQSAAALRPGEPFAAHVSRIDGNDLVVEMIATGQLRREEAAAVRVPGTRIAMGAQKWDGTLPGAQTTAWDDVRLDPAMLGEQSIVRLGWRSVVAKAFDAGGATYVLGYTSNVVTGRPFDADDISFVDIISSFFQTQFQQRWQSERIRYQSEHDALTGLPNRSHFRSRARIACAAREGYAVAILDLEAFREVNNVFGNLLGDALIVEVAAALQALTIGNEFIGRLGGDKFGICFPDELTRPELDERMNAYRGVFAKPFSTGDRAGTQYVGLDARIGVAWTPGTTSPFDHMMSRADAALYFSKLTRGDTVSHFVPGMEQKFQERKQLAGELLDAIARDQFVLFIQPHIDIRTRRVVGGEALIRWQHPTRGLLAPKDFIGFAETNGLIGQIDAWTLGRSIVITEMIGETQPDFRLFCNLSPVDLDEKRLLEQLRYAGRNITSAKLGIELTETGLMRDVRATMTLVSALRKQGIQVAIDDFGTGYSSLAYLKRLPFDIIKIDQSFVRNLQTDDQDRAICEAILSIGSRFGRTVIAEGVETAEQLAWLGANGCDVAQGYHICEPLALDDFLPWLIATTSEGPAPSAKDRTA